MSSPASTITTWAAHVQPGSPASPSHQTTTPRTRKHRRPSISRLHLNLAPSLPSLPRHARARSGSASFLHILDTPSTGSGVSPTRNNVNVNVMNNTPATPKSSPHTADPDPNNAFDLTALGYTSLFLHLPTPATPHHPTPTLPYNLPSNTNPTTTHISNPISNSNGNATANDNSDHNTSTKETKGTTDKTFRSAFARLRSRSFSALLRPRKPSSSSTPSTPPSNPASPSPSPNTYGTNCMDVVPPVPAIPAKYRTTSSTPTKNATKATNKEKKESKATNATEKKEKNTKDVKKVKEKQEKKHPLPPTLASELALLQFLDGGSLEDNIAALSHTNSSTHNNSFNTKSTTSDKGIKNGAGCGGEWVYTDACGRVWRDADEALEYVHLLAPSPTSSTSSVSPTPYSPAFSIVSISFPSPSLSPTSFPATPTLFGRMQAGVSPSTPSSPLTGGVFPATPSSPARMDAKWITFTAYSPSSPSFPSPSSLTATSSSPLNAKFARRRRASLVKRDSMHKMTVRRRLRQPRAPRTPPWGALPPTPSSSPSPVNPRNHEDSMDVDTDTDTGADGKTKRMGMAGLGFWAI